MSMQDTYVNVVGGIKVNETAADLAVLAALVSSYKGKSVDHNTLILGEVGLTGEVRRVAHVAKRIKEAAAVGFNRFVVPNANMSEIKQTEGIIPVETVEEALKKIFR